MCAIARNQAIVLKSSKPLSKPWKILYLECANPSHWKLDAKKFDLKKFVKEKY